MTEYPAYEVARQVTKYAAVVLADNPGVMTLEGTNTWILRAPDSHQSIVIDPGPDDLTHLSRVNDEAGSVATILLTHGHADHSAGARTLHELTGAPVRALDRQFRYGGEGLGEGDYIDRAGLVVHVLATPGHTSDSLCFLVDDGLSRSVLTGDTILGRGTTVVAYPDGVLVDYLDSLRRLVRYDEATVLPGHGPELPSAGAVAQHYLDHRKMRLDQVRQALRDLGAEATPMQVVETVYADVDKSLWPAAEMSVRAQLAYLRS